MLAQLFYRDHVWFLSMRTLPLPCGLSGLRGKKTETKIWEPIYDTDRSRRGRPNFKGRSLSVPWTESANLGAVVGSEGSISVYQFLGIFRSEQHISNLGILKALWNLPCVFAVWEWSEFSDSRVETTTLVHKKNDSLVSLNCESYACHVFVFSLFTKGEDDFWLVVWTTLKNRKVNWDDYSQIGVWVYMVRLAHMIF